MKSASCSCIVLSLVAAAAGGNEISSLPDHFFEFDQPEREHHSPGPSRLRIHAEAVFHLPEYRTSALPSPSDRPDWLAGAAAGVHVQKRLTDQQSLRADVQGVLYTTAERGDLRPTDWRVDVRELAWTRQSASHDARWQRLLDIGRLTQPKTLGLGFAPADHFRTARVNPAHSIDVGESRLGVVGVRKHWLWNRAESSVLISPKLTALDGSLWQDSDGWGLGLAQTNDRLRTQWVISFKASDRWTAQTLLLWDDGDWELGNTLSLVVTPAILLHAESNVAQRHSLWDVAMSADTMPDWGLQAAWGASITLGLSTSLTMEHHYNAFGLDHAQWQQWQAAQNSPAAAQANRVLQLARQRDEPGSMHRLLARWHWQEAGHPDLDLTALGLLNPLDGSAMVQPGLTWHVQPDLSLTMHHTRWLGGDESEFGKSFRVSNTELRLQFHI